MHDELKNLSRQKLNEELKAVEHENLQGSYEVSLEPVCCMGSMENVICNLAQERKVDYVFLGVGNGGPQESLLKVVGRVSCPVMLVAPPSQQ